MMAAERFEDGGRGRRERRCLVTGEVRPCAELIRFVVSPEGRVLPDLVGDLPGRGLWVAAARAALERAGAKGLFAKAARRPVVHDADLIEAVEAGLARRLLDWIGLAKRAGELVVGFEKVRRLIERGQVGVLVVAGDAGAEGRRKLNAGEAPVIDLFTRAELGRALGRAEVVHAALYPGRLAERLLADASRLRGVRNRNPLHANDAQPKAAKR